LRLAYASLRELEPGLRGAATAARIARFAGSARKETSHKICERRKDDDTNQNMIEQGVQTIWKLRFGI
jgi:hypothetical protein